MAYRPETLAVLDVAAVLEVGQLVMELVCLHAEAGHFDALAFELDISGQGSALGLKLEFLVIVSPIPLDLGKGCQVVEGMGHLSQGVIGVPIGVEEFHEPAWHRGGRAL